ncbi:MAG: peptidylprolyl isomerase [Burkholderiales bacterium]|nr:peptidylprolyl isomerase [Burkholderiales bacterium]
MPIFLFALLAASALLAAPLAHAEEILVARVNGTGISQQRLERGFEEDLRQRKMNLLQIRNPQRMKDMRRAVLDNLIEQELFWQEAQKTGVVATPDEVEAAYKATAANFKSAEMFESRIRAEGYTPETYRELVKRQVSASNYIGGVLEKAAVVSDEEVHRFYKDNPDKFHRPEQVRVRHVVLKVAKQAGEAERAEKRARMEEILKQARAGGDFEQLARQHSEAPTKQWGGEMDPFGRGQVAKPLEDAAFALAPGGISDVLSLPEGFQILKLESRSEEVTVSEDAARERVRNYLQQIKAKQVLAKEVERLRNEGDVKILQPT